MIRIITGHLACGRWYLKQDQGITFIAHPKMFSRHNEYRIGPDQVVAVEVEKQVKKHTQVKILFTDDRYCQALIDPAELAPLQAMATTNEAPPEAKNQTQNWIFGLAVFFVLCAIFELVK